MHHAIATPGAGRRCVCSASTRSRWSALAAAARRRRRGAWCARRSTYADAPLADLPAAHRAGGRDRGHGARGVGRPDVHDVRTTAMGSAHAHEHHDARPRRTTTTHRPAPRLGRRAARRHRRAGRERQDRAGRCLCRALDRRDVGRGRHQRHLHHRGRRDPRAHGVLPASASSACRPAAARTPRSATTSARTSTRSTTLEATVRPRVVLLESGGDNLTATFSRALVDVQIFVIDVAGGDKVPRKGGPGHHALGPARDQQDRPRAARGLRPRRDGDGDAAAMRGDRPTMFVSLTEDPDGDRRSRDGCVRTWRPSRIGTLV